MKYLNDRRPGQLILHGDPIELRNALGYLYGRHAATLTPEERRKADKIMCDLSSDLDNHELRSAVGKLRHRTTGTAW